MSRIRKANENAIINTWRFLQDIQIIHDRSAGSYGHTLQELYKHHKISKSTFSVCKKLMFVDDKINWLVGNPTREMALQVLEILRQQASKRIDVALSDEFVTSIERLTASMNTLSAQNEKSLKSPLLSRALNQTQQNNDNHLFSQVESNEAKKFELLKAIASGVHSVWTEGKANAEAISNTNTFIILATEDLFNKFFEVK